MQRHDNDPGPRHDISDRAEAAETIETECRRLKAIAESSGLDFLAYLIEVAEEEAAARKREFRQTS